MTTDRTDWHADREVLRALADGHLGPVFSASIEAHVMRCSACRTELNDLTFTSYVDEAWAGVREAVEAPAPGPVGRLLRGCGVRGDSLRLLAAVPAMRGGWLMGVTLALVFAGVAAGFSGDWGLGLFLLVSPLAPVAGVAAAYGGDADPSHEIVVTTPYSAGRLLLLRTVAVLGSCVPLAMLVGFVVPGPAWLTIAWLTPAVAGVAVTLALYPYFGLTNSAGSVGAVWSVLTLAAVRVHHDPLVLVGPSSQVGCLALVLVSVSVFLVKFQIIDLPRRQL
jgi:hypothetical protein